MAPKCKLLTLKVLDDGSSGYSSKKVEAVLEKHYRPSFRSVAVILCLTQAKALCRRIVS